MNKVSQLVIPWLVLCWSFTALAFDSGSTGRDGALNITEDTQLQLPPSGIFNYTGITIAEDVTLSFSKNANNTPVRLLISGDVLIDGTIDVSGQQGGAGDAIPVPFGGASGPGGFDGGMGGLPGSTGLPVGHDGQGPGRGVGGGSRSGTGGVFGARGGYGNSELLPLIGGSGGGGSSSSGSRAEFSRNNRGAGGGGGGGALLIAASGTVTINGSVLAHGGTGGQRASGSYYNGGRGSGGGIRITTTTLAGEGTISAAVGSAGRIRLEAETLNRISRTTPDYSFDVPGPILIPNLPTLRISSIGGVNVPTSPTGFRDIIFPGITTNPVTVTFVTTNVPTGNTIRLRVDSRHRSTLVVTSNPIAVDGSASASANFPYGDSALTAELTLELSASLGLDYSRYAQGQPVKQIRLELDAGGQSITTFITESGAEHTLPGNPLAMR